jgi:hypothetical protein
MAGVPAVRVSDAEREQATRTLSEYCARGHLELEELSSRIEEVYAARTKEELDRTMREMPLLPGPSRRRPKWLTLAIFGDAVRKGRWRVPRLTFTLSLFADVDLDLRHAVVEKRTATLALLAVFGNVDVYVPEGVEVDIGGIVLFGHRRDWGPDSAPLMGTPLIRVRALALFGTIDVWRVPQGTTGSYGEITKAVKRCGLELPAG